MEEKDPSLLIDRYKYMDLLPCNVNELRSLGYSPVSLFLLYFLYLLLLLYLHQVFSKNTVLLQSYDL